MTTAVLIGGANGAGKTTFARSLVPLLHPGAAFLNADEVAREGYAPLAAGREMLRRLDACVAARAPFVLETTLSSRCYAARIPAWRAAGYAVTLHFIEVPDADFAVAASPGACGQGVTTCPSRTCAAATRAGSRCLVPPTSPW